MQIRLIPDDAVGESLSRDADGLGFAAYADVLAHAALQAQGTLTIGVFGEWGSGKTSLMRLIQRRIEAHEHVVPVWFNAWRYEQDQHPVIPLVGTIVREIEARRQRLAAPERAGALVRALRAVAYGFSLKTKLGVPGVGEVEASFDGKAMTDRAEALAGTPLLERSLFFEAFEMLDQVEFSDTFQVVVFIDDLDRCFPDRAVKLLESIKLVLSQRGMVFVLGVAQDVLQDYLQHRYVTEYGVTGFRSSLYLDKLVQLGFRIPPSIGRMDEFSRVLLNGQPEPVAGQLASVLPLVGKALGGNPRAVIRFLNNLLIDLAVSSREGGHAPAIPLHFFAISRCLQARWPVVFGTLLATDALAVEMLGWDRAAIREAAQEDGPRGQVAATLLGDRQLEELLLGAQGLEWLADRDLRHASVDFLRGRARVVALEPEQRVIHDVLISYAPADATEATRLGELLADYGLLASFVRPSGAGSADDAGAVGGSSGPARALLLCIGRNGKLDPAQLALLQDFTDAGADMPSTESRRALPTFLPSADPGVEVPAAVHAYSVLDLRGGMSVDVLRPVVDLLRSRTE